MKSLDRRTALKLGALAAVSPAIASLAACASAGTGTQGGGSGAAPSVSYTLDTIREQIVGLDKQVELEDGTLKTMIGFDNAATTPPLKPVMEEIAAQMELYGSIGRGSSQKSDHSNDVYEATREKVLEFVGADPQDYTCIFTNTTTDSLNKLASALVKKDTVVLTTRLEHHSNLLPWRERCKTLYAEMDDKGRIIYEDFEKQLKANKVDYVAVTAASNVTGYITDVHRVAKMAHAHGAKIIVDGAQIVAHRKFSMKGATPDENIDYLAFSAHKMYTPFGGGVLIGPFEELNQHMPEVYGGGTVHIVGDDWVDYKMPPEKYEAGSPNYPGVVGLGKAIEVLESIGFDAIEEHERKLVRKMVDGLTAIDKVVVYGDTENTDDRVGVVTFGHPEVNTHLLAKRLAASYAVATRRGAFCAHPYVWRLMGQTDEDVHGFAECADANTAGMVRVSFGIYNTEAEVDEFLAAMPDAIEQAKSDVQFYSNAVPEY